MHYERIERAMTIHQEAPFAAATRIAAGDDGSNYDTIAIGLHWTTAVLVAVQFGLAETWDWFAKPTQESMQSLHVSFGVLLTAAVVARIVWRFVPGHEMSSLESGWMKLASKGVHYLLYALLVAQAGLGFTIGWSNGHPIHLFGLPIPGPFAALARPVRHELRDIHDKVGWAIVILAGVHALAALYHHYGLKDRVLERMLPAAR